LARIGIYGGTFNPPHNGHLYAAQQAWKQLSLDKVIFIPANIPPHKQLPADSATSKQRYEMVCLAAASYAWAEVSDLELRAEGKNYTVDTLRKLQTIYPNDDLYLIIGTDMLLTLDRWYCPEELMRLAHIAAVGREYGDEPAMQAVRARLTEQFDADIRIITCEPLPMSSTQVRAFGGSEELEQCVPDSVCDYIRAHGLYRSEKESYGI